VTIRKIIKEYPQLNKEDIRAAIAYGAEMSRERYEGLPIVWTGKRLG
jgi:uncharacterized protein (DUF433 family)